MLDVQSITEDDCILFMWTTGPQMSNSIELGEAWGFEYKPVAFGWDNWGLEIPDEKVEILSQADIEAEQNLFSLQLVNA